MENLTPVHDEIPDPAELEVPDPNEIPEPDGAEPPADEPPAPIDLGRPFSPTTTPIHFPVVLRSVDGQLEPLLVTALAEPAERVAELVEALQDSLIAPPAVAALEALVAEGLCLEVTDAASYRRATEVYEQLAANEKGIELSIGPVVAFFHRPWNAMTKFRAKFAKPVEVAKKQLSDRAGAWDVSERRRVETERRQREDEAKREEQARLQKLADTATKNGDAKTAAVVQEMVAEVQPPALPLEVYKPTVETKTRKAHVAVLVNEDAFYAAIAAGQVEHRAAPIDLAYMNRQAKDLGEEFGKKYPGFEAREKGGLSASGKR